MKASLLFFSFVFVLLACNHKAIFLVSDVSTVARCFSFLWKRSPFCGQIGQFSGVEIWQNALLTIAASMNVNISGLDGTVVGNLHQFLAERIGSGIGKDYAVELLNQGYRVILTGRRRDPLEATAEVSGALADQFLIVPSDVSAPEQVKDLFTQAVNKFNKVDVLFNKNTIKLYEKR